MLRAVNGAVSVMRARVQPPQRMAGATFSPERSSPAGGHWDFRASVGGRGASRGAKDPLELYCYFKSRARLRRARSHSRPCRLPYRALVASMNLDLFVTGNRYGNIDVTDDSAWRLGQCSECGGSQLSVIAFRRPDTGGPEMAWLRCTNCKSPLTSLNGALRPAVKPLSMPRGVPDVEATVWNEVRECLAVGAYTAAVMMCRKLLLHVAVTYKLAERIPATVHHHSQRR
jgi:hypothetical protein